VVVRLVPLLAWLFAVATLLSRDRLGRFRFASMGLAPLDQFPGVRNWTVGFPFVALRMVSFAVDHHDALTGAALPPPAPKVSSDTYRRLQDTSRPPDRYSFVNYLGFVFYAPLAVAGPICSFNAWHAQMEAPHPTPPRDLLLYTGRLLFAYVCLIAVLHVSYVTAIVDTATHGFPDLFKLVSGMEFVMFSFCIFMFTWLKLLVIWRFFRLWALLAGVYTVENMTRCVLNNYSALDFWRSWHCSFNVWILRYLYVPLGGNRRRLLNTFVAFTFVAVWHDLDWRLVHWAWGVVAIVVPELLVLRIVSGPRLLRLRSQWFYRPLCITAMAANASLLILANSAGFFFFGPSLQVLAASWWSGVSLGAALWYGAFLWALMDIALYVRR
jgi:D-alanyl-lipoteichoic acid acyltransferase DltB (MBOAT superfamily)